MDVITYTDVWNNLKSVMDGIVDDCSEVTVTRRNGEPVVMMSLASWKSMSEMEYLSSNPANAHRFNRGIRQFERNEGVERDLTNP